MQQSFDMQLIWGHLQKQVLELLFLLLVQQIQLSEHHLFYNQIQLLLI